MRDLTLDEDDGKSILKSLSFNVLSQGQRISSFLILF